MDVDVNVARERLAREGSAARERLAALRRDFTGMVDASRDSNADDEHDPEGSTIAFERQQVDTLVRQTERHLVEVEAALEWLDAGEYGVCERWAGRSPRRVSRPARRRARA